jgi:hypothetical protein
MGGKGQCGEEGVRGRETDLIKPPPSGAVILVGVVVDSLDIVKIEIERDLQEER